MRVDEYLTICRALRAVAAEASERRIDSAIDDCGS